MEVSSDGYDLSRKQKNAYIELLADMVRRNDSRPVKLFTTFLLTLGQMAAVAVLCATRLEGRERVFAIVWSLLLAGITLLRRRTVRQRKGHAAASGIRRSAPGGLLARAQAAHRRKRAARQLRRPAPFLPASCGRPVEERADALYIYCGGTIFDIIPAEAFKNAEAMQRFARDLARRQSRPKMPGEKTDAVPTAAADLTWEMDEKQFLDGQFIAFRTLYYRYRFVPGRRSSAWRRASRRSSI